MMAFQRITNSLAQITMLLRQPTTTTTTTPEHNLTRWHVNKAHWNVIIARMRWSEEDVREVQKKKVQVKKTAIEMKRASNSQVIRTSTINRRKKEQMNEQNCSQLRRLRAIDSSIPIPIIKISIINHIDNVIKITLKMNEFVVAVVVVVAAVIVKRQNNLAHFS